MELKAAIDRFEDDKAVLLAGDGEVQIIWPRKLLPNAEEGDILSIKITVDAEATSQARAEADILFQQLIEKNK